MVRFHSASGVAKALEWGNLVTSTGICIFAPAAVRRLEAVGAPVEYTFEGIKVGVESRPGRFGRMRLIPYADPLGSLVELEAVEKEERWYQWRKGA